MSSNVVRLPSSARRKVQQRYNRHFRQVVPAMRADWPGEYISPEVRRQLPDAEALLLLRQTPELLLCLAIFQTLAPEQQAQVRHSCEAKKPSVTSARSVAAAIQARTTGESVSLAAAMDLLRKRGEELA